MNLHCIKFCLADSSFLCRPDANSLVYDWKKLLAALNADFPMLLRASKDGAKVIRGYILTKTASLGEVTAR